jgi:hypothetical protein
MWPLWFSASSQKVVVSEVGVSWIEGLVEVNVIGRAAAPKWRLRTDRPKRPNPRWRQQAREGILNSVDIAS